MNRPRRGYTLSPLPPLAGGITHLRSRLFTNDRIDHTDLQYLQDALLFDANGTATDRHERVRSTNFDEIRLWSDQVYMPYRVLPVGRDIRPDSCLHALTIGSMIISRFSYGIPVRLKDFGMDAGVGMVLTTLRGHARHWQDSSRSAETRCGESFVVDNTQVDYLADFDPRHLQLNVTFSHAYLAQLYTQLTGYPAPQSLWEQKVKFADDNRSWSSLLEYVLKMACANPERVRQGLLAKHLEEMLGTNILLQWSAACGLDIHNPPHQVTPGYVIKAEAYMREHAPKAPTLTEIAAAVGVSGRALHKGFKNYRNTTPMRYLRDLRLDGVRRELQGAAAHISVAEIAYAWGYLNLGRFALAYRKRFGELPSQTRMRGS